MADITIIGTVLHSVLACTKSFVFPSKVKETKEGTGSSYVFQEVKDIVEDIIFEAGNSLENLGHFTFYMCSKIKTIDLSTCLNLKTIGKHCFSSCTSLSNVKLPDDGVISSLNDYCFSSTKIVDFHLPKSIQFCGWYIFSSCNYLDTVTTVKDVSFSNLWTFAFSSSSIRHFIVPKAVSSLGVNSLQATQIETYEIDPENQYFSVYRGNIYSKDFTILHAVTSVAKSIEFHPNCTSLLSRAFMWTTIPEVNFPSYINIFCSQCFYLSRTTKVTISNATSIPGSMFIDSSINNLVLPSNAVSLGSSFLTGTTLKYLFVPKSVKNLDNAFAGCHKDLVVEFENGSPFSFDYGYLYNDKKSRLHAYMGDETSIEILTSIEDIDGSVFNGKSTITSIIFLGSNVKNIGTKCFAATTSLHQIKLPSSLVSLGSSCFSKSGIKEITIPGSIISVPKHCFDGCKNLENVTISEGISTLSEASFIDCIKLQRVNFPNSLSDIQISSFKNTGLKNIHFDPPNRNNIKLSIAESVFTNCAFESVVLESRVCSIGNNAFERCSLLKHVDIIDSSITELPPLTFYSCSNLSSIYLPSSLWSIGDRCFECCGFERFSIPASVSQLGSRAFGSNANLVTVSLASNTSLSTIISTSFRGCSSLREFVFDGKSWTFTSIDGVLVNTVSNTLCVYPPAHVCGGDVCDEYEVPLRVTSIGPSAFLDSPLSVIILHSNVVEIGARAFDSCQRLKKLVIESPSLGVSVLSFDGVGYRCGLIECSADVMNQLEDVGVPSVALLPCPTDFPSLVAINRWIGGLGLAAPDE